MSDWEDLQLEKAELLEIAYYQEKITSTRLQMSMLEKQLAELDSKSKKLQEALQDKMTEGNKYECEPTVNMETCIVKRRLKEVV